MVILDTTIVNVALPRIIQVFQTNVSTGQLVLAGYMLALAVVVPASGYLSDRFGAKRTYLMTIILFTLGSALCGLAPNIEGLIIFRVIQGLGGGMLMPLGMSLLFQVAPPQQRGTMMGVFGLPLLIAPMIGPTLGGYLVEYVDWRPIFTMNIPVGILATIAGMLILRETPEARGDPLRLGRLHPLGDGVLDGDAGAGAGAARGLGRPARHDPAAASRP